MRSFCLGIVLLLAVCLPSLAAPPPRILVNSMTTNDEVTIRSIIASIAATNSSAEVNVKAYGALGDNSHDDTAAIRAANNSVASGGTVLFPPGVYRISGPITNSANLVKWKGAGYLATTIKATTADSRIQIDGGSPSTLVYLNSIEDLGFNGSQISTNGFLLNHASECVFKNFRVQSCVGPAAFVSVGLATFDNCDFQLSDYGVWFGSCTHVKFNDGNFYWNTNGHVVFAVPTGGGAVDTAVFSGCWFERSKAILRADASFLSGVEGRGIVLRDSDAVIGAPTERLLYAATVAANALKLNVTIDGNRFYAATATHLIECVQSNTVSGSDAIGVNFNNNQFHAGPTVCVAADATGVLRINAVGNIYTDFLPVWSTNAISPFTLLQDGTNNVVTSAHFIGNGRSLTNLDGGQLSGNVLNTTNGNVGIGTANPAEPLSIDGAGTDGKLRLSHSAFGTAIKMYRYGGSGSDYFPFYVINSEGPSGTSFAIAGDASASVIGTETVTDYLTVDTAGKVGVGTNNPQVRFHVNGAALIDGTVTGNGAGLTNLQAVGEGVQSTVVGAGAASSGAQSTAYGNSATASGSSSTAVGVGATASANFAVTVGGTADGYGGTALGISAVASGSNSIAIGASSFVSGTGTNSAAIGAGVSVTRTNLIQLGTPATDVAVGRDLEVAKGFLIKSNTFPCTANFANLAPSSAILWNSNGVHGYWISTNSIAGTVTTNVAW